MNPIMIEVLIYSCHVVPKRIAKTSKCFIYDSFLIKPSAETSAFLSTKNKQSNFKIILKIY